jgi:hypothetical protein
MLSNNDGNKSNLYSLCWSRLPIRERRRSCRSCAQTILLARSLTESTLVHSYAPQEIKQPCDASSFSSQSPSNHLAREHSATKVELFDSIIRSGDGCPARDTARSRRQSRVSREIVSSSQGSRNLSSHGAHSDPLALPDSSLSHLPTAEWQSRLSRRLAVNAPLATSSAGHANSFHSSPTFDMSGIPFSRRRRLDSSPLGDRKHTQLDWNEMYDMDGLTGEDLCPVLWVSLLTHETDDSEGDISEDTSGGIGQLSLDENQQVWPTISTCRARELTDSPGQIPRESQWTPFCRQKRPGRRLSPRRIKASTFAYNEGPVL